jgi:hypothetical protein
MTIVMGYGVYLAKFSTGGLYSSGEVEIVEMQIPFLQPFLSD